MRRTNRYVEANTPSTSRLYPRASCDTTMAAGVEREEHAWLRVRLSRRTGACRAHTSAESTAMPSKRRQHADAGFAHSKVQPWTQQNVIQRHVAFGVPQHRPEGRSRQPRDARRWQFHPARNSCSPSAISRKTAPRATIAQSHRFARRATVALQASGCGLCLAHEGAPEGITRI